MSESTSSVVSSSDSSFPPPVPPPLPDFKSEWDRRDVLSLDELKLVLQVIDTVCASGIKRQEVLVLAGLINRVTEIINHRTSKNLQTHSKN